jgi:hypothetical protein
MVSRGWDTIFDTIPEHIPDRISICTLFKVPKALWGKCIAYGGMEMLGYKGGWG